MTPRLLTIPAAVALTLGLAAGTASANNPVARADCETGLTFNMSDGVAGTRITATLDGQPVGPRNLVVANQHDSTSFTVASPDQTVSHVWTVLVDAPWDIADQSFRYVVGACATPTTTVPATSTTTSTTVPPVVANDIPPTVPPTVPGRPVATTTTVPPPAFTLPETGASSFTYGLALGALAVVTVGEGLRRNGRRGGGS